MKVRSGRTKGGTREEITKRARKHRKKHSSRMLKTASEEIITAINECSVREQYRKRPTGESRKRRNADLQRLRQMGQRQKRTYIHDDLSKETEEIDSNSVDRTINTQAAGGGETNNVSMSGNRAQKWVSGCCQKGLRPLLKEFATIRKFLPKTISTEYFSKNGNKNRYMDVLCLDDTRVVLQGRAKESDYIHANWVLLPSQRKYICTQGPLDETIEDFWLMVFKEKVPVIIMLCDLCEGGETKCAEYYPNVVGKVLTFGEIKVTNLQKEKSTDTIICFTLSVEMSNETRKITHYKWPDWPDRVAPPSACPIVDLVLRTKPMYELGPFVVHCSAGIGRTGTYCALEYAIDKLTLGDTLSIVEVIKEIRKQRLHSVQTTLQYLFLHVCIIEYLATTKVVPRDSHIRKFQRDYERYLKKFNEKNTKGV